MLHMWSNNFVGITQIRHEYLKVRATASILSQNINRIVDIWIGVITWPTSIMIIITVRRYVNKHALNVVVFMYCLWLFHLYFRHLFSSWHNMRPVTASYNREKEAMRDSTWFAMSFPPHRHLLFCWHTTTVYSHSHQQCDNHCHGDSQVMPGARTMFTEGIVTMHEQTGITILPWRPSFWWKYIPVPTVLSGVHSLITFI